MCANSEIRTFALPKSGGAQTHLCPPTFESGEARAPPAPPSPTPLSSNTEAIILYT